MTTIAVPSPAEREMLKGLLRKTVVLPASRKARAKGATLGAAGHAFNPRERAGK